MNYFDVDLSYKKPVYASRKNSNLISPINLLCKQYKQLSEGKGKTKKKKKSKKCKSSLWLKNKLLHRPQKRIEMPLKSLLKANFMIKNLGKPSRSQNRTSQNFSKQIHIKKICNNNDLILDGENMLDSNNGDEKVYQNKEDRVKSANQSTDAFGEKKYTIHSSMSPLLPVNLPNKRLDIRKFEKQAIPKTPARQESKGSSCVESIYPIQNLSCGKNLKQKRRKNLEFERQQRAKSRESKNTAQKHRTCNNTLSPKTKRMPKAKMLLPKFIEQITAPEMLQKARIRTKSAKPKGTNRPTLAKVTNYTAIGKAKENLTKRSARKGARRSFDLGVKFSKGDRHRTPKHKNKYTNSITCSQRQRSSMNVAAMRKAKKHNRRLLFSPYD